MIFRKATLNDLIEMQQLFIDTILTICKYDYSSEELEVWASSVEKTERWHDVINNQFVILAEIDTKIVGYATLKNGNYIDFFYVHKDFQRKGIADKLLSKIETEAKKLNLQVLSSDISITAKPFFEKKGFYHNFGTKK
jgi:putative acetyltransferase